MDGQSLQKLLASIAGQPQQSPQSPFSAQTTPQSAGAPDLSALLSSMASQQGRQQTVPQQAFPQQGTPSQGFPAYGFPPQQQYQQMNGPPNASNFQNNPALSQFLQNASNRPMSQGLPGPNQVPQQHQQQQQNVQDIMAQLARYK